MWKNFISLSTVALVGLMTSIALAEEKPNLTIGVVFPLSGAQSTYGEESINGVDLAIEKLKTSDPELAKRIKIVREDDKSNPVDAATAVKKLLSVDKVDLILGSVASSNTLSMTAAVNQAGIPLVTPASTNPSVTKKGDMIFRTCFIDPFQGSVVASFALNKLGKKTAGILLDHKSDYSKGFAEFFTKAFTSGGGKVVATEAYEAGKKDFRTQLTNLRMAQPDVLLVPGYYQEVGLIMKQAHQMGYKVPMLGGDGWDSPTLYKLAGPTAAAGHYFSTHFSADDTDPVVRAFVKTYTEKYKQPPGAMAALGYDGFLVVVDAFKRAGSDKPKALAKALAETKGFEGVTGKITINASRDAEKAAVVLKTTADGAVFNAKIDPEDAGKDSH